MRSANKPPALATQRRMAVICALPPYMVLVFNRNGPLGRIRIDCRELQRLGFEPALIEERLQGSTSRGLKLHRMASSGDAARK